MYDLAAQMRRNIHFFLQRAESQVYAEPKRLVKLGLAKAHKEKTGRRTRTVYDITEKGRDALAHWLAAPISKGPVVEFETLLRVMLAPFGRDEDLRAALLQTKADIADLSAMAAGIRTEYLEGRAPFQRHMIHRAMIFDFLSSFAVLVEEWAERSCDRLDGWANETEQQRTAAAFEVFRTGAKRHVV